MKITLAELRPSPLQSKKEQEVDTHDETWTGELKVKGSRWTKDILVLKEELLQVFQTFLLKETPHASLTHTQQFQYVTE